MTRSLFARVLVFNLVLLLYCHTNKKSHHQNRFAMLSLFYSFFYPYSTSIGIREVAMQYFRGTKQEGILISSIPGVPQGHCEVSYILCTGGSLTPAFSKDPITTPSRSSQEFWLHFYNACPFGIRNSKKKKKHIHRVNLFKKTNVIGNSFQLAHVKRYISCPSGP